MFTRRCLLFTALLAALLPAWVPAFGGEPDVDEFLFPMPGALDENIKILEARVEAGAGSSDQALYGIQLLSGGNHAAARQHCEEALVRGLLFEPVYCMALILFREGKLAEAADKAVQAIGLRPKSAAPRILLANLRKTQQDRDGMVKAMEDGLAAVPERASFWEWELALMFEQLDDLDAALQCLGRLERLTPRDPRVFVQSGDWLRRLDRTGEAAAMYRIALTKASWYEPAVLALLDTYKADGRWQDIRSVAADFLDNPQIANLRETVLAFKEQAEVTLVDQEWKALENQHQVSFLELHVFDNIEPPRASAILCDAARAAFRFDRHQDALPLLRKAHALSPSDGKASMMLGEALLRAGQLEAAAPLVEEAVAALPSTEAHVLAAELEVAQGRHSDCVTHARKALEYSPDSASVLLLLARCHRTLRESEAELTALEHAHRVDPENTAALQELVSYFLHMRNGAEMAASFLEKLYNLLPYDYRLCIKLGELRLELRTESDALSAWARCLSSIPPEPASARDELYSRMQEIVRGMRTPLPAVQALTTACEAGVAQACTDVESLLGSKKEKLELKASQYTARKGGRKLVGELERLGPGGQDFLVLGLDAPGIENLTRQERIFLYFMNRAAIAGDDLLYMQNHRHALLLKKLMELLFIYRGHLPKDTAEAIHDYLKYLWVNHGNYDHRSGRKFLPAKLSPAMLRDAMTLLMARGETFDFIPGLEVDEKLGFLADTVFDPAHEPALTVTQDTDDVVLASAVNHYDPGVTGAMIAKLSPEVRTALNVRFSLRGGEVIPQCYKVGGLGSQYVENIVFFLEKAAASAQSPEQAEAIRELIEFYNTGSEDAFRRHSMAWLRSRDRTDYLNGFIEQLKDPRGTIGNYEGLAAFVEIQEPVERLADSAGWFEERMPWPEQFKRKDVGRPVTNVAVAVMGTGDMGPVPWAGYNLPNYDDIRSGVGSKNVVFVNILTARSSRDFDATVEEFYLPEYRPLVKKHGDLANHWLVYMHEIIGHGSGKSSPELKDDPRAVIGSSFSSLEEARADLVALYFIGDAKLEEIGAIPKGALQEVQTCAYVQFFQGFLTLYRRFEGGVLDSAHMKGRQLIMQYLLRGGEDGKGDYGLAVEDVDGKLFVRVKNAALVREGLGRLLERIQVVKSMGHKDGAEQLVEQFGARYDEGWAKGIAERATALGLPRQTAFVYPRLEPVVDRGGNVVDVVVRNDEDLTAQHLRFSRLQGGRALE